MRFRLTILALASVLAAVTAGVACAAPAARFGPGIVWRGGDAASVETCNAAPTVADSWSCLLGKMRAGGASAEAIGFAGRLNAMDNPGWADGFKPYGRIALVSAVYPFRANTNGGYVLVGGSPAIVNTEGFDLGAADKRRSDYRRLIARAPEVFLITRLAFDRFEARPHGAQRFVFTDYFATCRACALEATAYIAFDFDARGRFLGSRLLSVGPPPKS